MWKILKKFIFISSSSSIFQGFLLVPPILFTKNNLLPKLAPQKGRACTKFLSNSSWRIATIILSQPNLQLFYDNYLKSFICFI